MQLSEKITIPQSLQNGIENGTLTISDHLMLAAAQLTATLFPDTETYIGLPQTAVAPAFFIDYDSIANKKRLKLTSEYEFMLKITYVPVDSADRRELQNTIFLLEQSLDRLQSEIGIFRCFSRNSNIADGLAQVTGTVKVWETDVPDDPIIGHADQNITL